MMRWFALGSLLFACAPSATFAVDSSHAPRQTGTSRSADDPVASPEPVPAPHCKLDARVPPLDDVARRLINGTLLAMRTEWASDQKSWDELEIECSVTYNADDVLSTHYFLCGRSMAMGWSEWWTFRRSNGERLRIEQLLQSASFSVLVAHLDALLQRELQLAHAGALPDIDTACAGLDYQGTFELSHLQNFEVTPDGMTFTYPYGFPQAYRACQPLGRFSLPFGELGPTSLPLGRVPAR
jgi:hypothetical protein